MIRELPSTALKDLSKGRLIIPSVWCKNNRLESGAGPRQYLFIIVLVIFFTGESLTANSLSTQLVKTMSRQSVRELLVFLSASFVNSR